MFFSNEQIITTLKEVAAKNSDFIYDKDLAGGMCRYAPTDDYQHRCLIGEMLHVLGVSDDDLRTYDDGYATDAASVVHDFNEDSHLLAALDDVQSSQDRGEPWGLAIRHLGQFFFGGDDAESQQED